MKRAGYLYKFLFICFLALLFIGRETFAAADILTGIGYGKTENEAKTAAMDDLASLIKTRVYSKYSLSKYESGNRFVNESTRFVKIISDVPIINPQVGYFKEPGRIKAVVNLSDASGYIKRLNGITSSINSMLKKAKDTDDASLRFAILGKVLPFYDEFDKYAVVPMVMGVDGYDKPSLTEAEVLEQYLAMEETPPNLNVAADILTSGFKERRNIFVATPLTVSGEVTDFGVFFGKLLSSKINASIEEQVDFRLKCVYAETGEALLTTCSLFSGGSSVASTAVRIPLGLVAKINYKPKSKDMGELSKAGNSVGKLRASVRISPEDNPNILRDGDYFTILVRLNKAAYVYVAAFPGIGSIGISGIEPIGGQNGFLRLIDEEKTGVWVSLGRFKAGYPLGASTIYLFAISDEQTDAEKLIPEYLREKLYSAEKTREEVASDLMGIFNKLDGEKTLSVTNIPTAGK